MVGRTIHTMQPPALPALLFRQLCLLAWMAGLAGLRYPLPSLTFMVVLMASHWPRCRAWQRLALLCGCATLGMLMAHYGTPQPPQQLPHWYAPNVPVTVSARITGVDALPDHRLRLILADVHPAEAIPGAPTTPPPLPGNLALTWESPTSRPGVGQYITATLRITHARGFANPGSAESDAYWALRDVWFRAWTRGPKGGITTSGSADAGWALRDHIRQRLELALEPAPRVPATPAPPVPLAPAPTPRNAPPDDDAESPQAVTQPTPAQLSPGRAVLPAIIFGDRFHMASADLDLLARTDLLHSIALSGQHLAVAGLMAAGVVFLLTRARPTLLLHLSRTKLLALCALPPAAAYLWLGNAPPSLLRAALMLGFFCLMLMGDRPRTLIDGLIWAVACILALSPAAVHDLGLQLSALAVAALALAAPLLTRIMHHPFFAVGNRPTLQRLLRRTALGVALLFATSLAVQLALMPLALVSFGRFSPWFVLNVLWLPVADLVVLPVGVASLPFLAWDTTLPVARWLLTVAAAPCDALYTFLHWLHGAGWLDIPYMLRPHWTAMLGYGCVMIAVCAGINRPRLPAGAKHLAAMGCALLLVGPTLRLANTLHDTITLTILDVGQGQALHIRYPSGSVLIDGGGFASPRFDSGRDLVAPALTHNAPPRLTHMLNTHPDRDHLRGLLFLLRTFRVGHYADSGDAPHNSYSHERDALLAHQGLDRTRLAQGDIIRLDARHTLEVLHPPRTGRVTQHAGNNGSLVLRLTRDGQGLAVLSGDVETAGLRQLMDQHPQLHAQVLVLPHHGAASSLHAPFYDAVAPRLAVASCGAWNQWNFPSPPVRTALEERAIPLLTTADAGFVSVTWDDAAPPTLVTGRAQALPEPNAAGSPQPKTVPWPLRVVRAYLPEVGHIP